MLTRLFTAIRPRPSAPPACDELESCRWSAVASGPCEEREFGQVNFRPADDTVNQFRALAECCADGFAALGYAQFADLLELPRPVRISAIGNLRAGTALPGGGGVGRPGRDVGHRRPTSIGRDAIVFQHRDLRV
jgi:hypothetical protein